MDPRPIAFALMASSMAYAQERPIVTECHDLSEEIEGCLCLDEDKILDAVAELRACRENKKVIPDSSTLGWAERIGWLLGALIAIWIV